MTLKSNESQIKVYASKNDRGYSTNENNFTFLFDNMTDIMPILGWERKKISLLLLPFLKSRSHSDPFSKVAGTSAISFLNISQVLLPESTLAGREKTIFRRAEVVFRKSKRKMN